MKSMKTSKTGKLENVWLHWLDIVLFKSSVLLVMHGTSDVREASLERQKVTLYDQLTFDYHALPGNISCVKLITFTLLPSVWASHSVCVTAFALKMHIHGNLLWNKCKLRIKWLYVSTHFVCFLLCIFVQWHSLDNISEIYDHASFSVVAIYKKKVTIVTPPTLMWMYTTWWAVHPTLHTASSTVLKPSRMLAFHSPLCWVVHLTLAKFDKWANVWRHLTWLSN